MNTATLPSPLPSGGNVPSTQEEWSLIETTLHHYVTHCIYTYSVPCWQNQIQELTEDVVQEVFLRALTYADKAERGEVPSIGSFEALCKTIAKRLLLDQRRKDKHLVNSIESITIYDPCADFYVTADPAETVLEGLSLLSLFVILSQIIVRFPEKQRIALLVDLANNADLDDEVPCLLEQAMWEVGVSLREYCCSLPHDAVLRSRHSSLLWQAYKRLQRVASTQLHQLDLVP